MNRLLPRSADNAYSGSKLALRLFGILLLLKIVMSVNCIFAGYKVATSADGMPLDTFTPAGAQAAVYLIAAWGLAQLMLCVLGMVSLVRYRALVPLMFAVHLLELVTRKAIQQFIPVVRVGSPPGYYVTLFLLALMVVGLALSLWPERSTR